MLSVGIDFKGGSLKGVTESLNNALDVTSILDEAAAVLLNRIRTRFLAETDPEGKPWEPSKAGIKRRANGGTGTLFNTGTLFRSIQLHSSGADSRAISTDVPYARKHQLGLDGNKKRVFLGFSQDDAKIVERLLEIRVKKVLT